MAFFFSTNKGAGKGASLAAIALWLLVLFCAPPTANAQVVINEILFNPPSSDSPNEYIELRGPPNLILSPGTYFVSVEGDSIGNPGTIQHVFDLSGKAIGGNGVVGIYHETYLVNAGQYEAVYGNMPLFGLAAATQHVPAVGRRETARRRLGGQNEPAVPTPTA